MGGRNRILVIGAASAVLIGVGASAMALRPDSEMSAAVSASAPNTPINLEAASASGAVPAATPVQSVAAPVIPSELRAHSARIQMFWAEGANLADHYVQMTVPCDGHDCRELIVGNLLTGEIVQTGMGFAAMPDLIAVSSRDSANLRLSWVNVAGGNCVRATYRWTGEQLAADEDIFEFPYEDAGCDRALPGD